MQGRHATMFGVFHRQGLLAGHNPVMLAHPGQDGDQGYTTNALAKHKGSSSESFLMIVLSRHCPNPEALTPGGAGMLEAIMASVHSNGVLMRAKVWQRTQLA